MKDLLLDTAPLLEKILLLGEVKNRVVARNSAEAEFRALTHRICDDMNTKIVGRIEIDSDNDHEHSL